MTYPGVFHSFERAKHTVGLAAAPAAVPVIPHEIMQSLTKATPPILNTFQPSALPTGGHSLHGTQSSPPQPLATSATSKTTVVTGSRAPRSVMLSPFLSLATVPYNYDDHDHESWLTPPEEPAATSRGHAGGRQSCSSPNKSIMKPESEHVVGDATSCKIVSADTSTAFTQIPAFRDEGSATGTTTSTWEGTAALIMQPTVSTSVAMDAAMSDHDSTGSIVSGQQQQQQHRHMVAEQSQSQVVLSGHVTTSERQGIHDDQDPSVAGSAISTGSGLHMHGQGVHECMCAADVQVSSLTVHTGQDVDISRATAEVTKEDGACVCTGVHLQVPWEINLLQSGGTSVLKPHDAPGSSGRKVPGCSRMIMFVTMFVAACAWMLGRVFA